MIMENPRKSMGLNGAFSHTADRSVAAMGSTQAYRLARAGPMSFTPCIYRVKAAMDPRKR